MLEEVCRYRRGILVKVALLLVGVPLVLYAFSMVPPAAHTGGFGEPNCTEAGCHVDNQANPPGGSVTIGRPDTYTPGATVPITVLIQDSATGRVRWGFQLSARFRSGRQAGSLAPGPNVFLQTLTGVQYAQHAAAVTQPGNSFTYTVMWTAPPDASGGDVVFNAAANAANGDGNNVGTRSGGDRIFTTQAVSMAPSGTPARLFAGGIVNAASFAPAPNNTAAPGALISIFGENLAPSPGGATALPLPTDINGTRVLVNNVPAPLIFVSPGQINAQAPFEAAAGSTANVVVQVAGRPNSAPEPLRVETVSPGIFTLTQDGTGAGAILHADFSVVNNNSPARPGETVLIFCNGLGQTQPPPLESGKPGAGQRTLEIPTLIIGGQNARVDFSGAAPGFAGLYQINAVIPNLAAGDHEIIITIAGRQSRSSVTLRVQP